MSSLYTDRARTRSELKRSVAADDATLLTANVFVGRDRELAYGHAALTEVLTNHGRLLLLGGEPGIGKTRLASEIAAHALQRGATVLWGRCWEGDGAPAFWPWLQIVRRYVSCRAAAALVGEMGAGAADIAHLVPELRHRLPHMPPYAPPLDPAEARFRLLDSLTAFLKAAAAVTPVVVILDDLHYADYASLLLLQFLAGELRDVRLLVVGTYRDVEVGLRHPMSMVLGELLRHGYTQRLVLHGFDQAETARFVQAMAGGAPHASIVATLFERTEGNPLFLQELVRLLRADGRLDEAGACVAGTALPQTVREVIDERLARLSPGCHETLSNASGIGREFDLHLLTQVSRCERKVLLERIDEAVAARVVAEETHRPGSYRFTHVLVQETLADALAPSQRARLHGDIGCVLELRSTDDDGHRLTALAHHFSQAAPAGHAEKAADYALQAGERMSKLFAHNDAVKYYDLALQALRLTSSAPERYCEVLLRLGDALKRCGQMPRARETFIQVIERARHLRAATLLARAALGLGEPWAEWGFPNEVLINALREADTALGDHDAGLHAKVLAGLAMALSYSATAAELATILDRALAMAQRIGDRHAELFVLFAQHDVQWLHDAGTRLVVATDIAQLAGNIGDKEMVLRSRLWRRRDLEELGEMAAADVELELCAQLADGLRNPRYHWQVAMSRAMRALLRGQFDKAEGLITDAWSIGRRGTEATVADEYLWIQLFSLRRGQGRLTELEPAIRAAIEKYPGYPATRAGLALLLCEAGTAAEAQTVIESVIADASFNLEAHQFQLITLAILCEACVWLADRPRAEILYRLFQPYAKGTVVMELGAMCEGSAARYLGMLASTMTRWDDAEKHFEAALAMDARIGAPPLLARTQYEYAKMLLQRRLPGDAEQGFSLLSTAAVTFEQLGMSGCFRVALALQRSAREWADGTPPFAQPATGDTGVPIPPLPLPHASQVFRRDGQFWTIAYNGHAFHLKDTKGIRYIARLLRHEGRAIHAVELVATSNGSTEGPCEHRFDAELGHGASRRRGLGDAGTLLDAKAAGQYRQRLRELQEELIEAEQFNDTGRVGKLQAEVEFLGNQLAAALGRGGRLRKVASAAERARVNVRNCIAASLKTIRQHHRDLWLHLFNTIRTGTFCSYTPDKPIHWVL